MRLSSYISDIFYNQTAPLIFAGLIFTAGPIVVATVQRLLQRAQRVGLLGAVVVGGIAAVAQGDIALVVDALTRVTQRVGIVEPALAVVDDLHAGADAVVATNLLTIHLNPHDGQVGRVQAHASVVGREILRPLVARQQREQHQGYEEEASHLKRELVIEGKGNRNHGYCTMSKSIFSVFYSRQHQLNEQSEYSVVRKFPRMHYKNYKNYNFRISSFYRIYNFYNLYSVHYIRSI